MSEDGEYEEDNINYKAICCEQIPELFLDKLVAKRHFSKFGKINRFILRPKRLSCTVEYETEEEAERAYMDGATFNGLDFLISYAEREVAHVQNTEEWVDPDVQSELEAMNPGYQRMTAAASLRSSLMTAAATQPALKMPKALGRLAKPAVAIQPSGILKPLKALTSNRTDSPTPIEQPRISTMARNELEAILRKPAYTNEEKYRVLDARDKLIRLTTVRQTDIKKAKATKGTCPDMCPEKERLMREFQRQVSTFEMADDNEYVQSTISHRKAIKEYSRSSADQEVPLSHELRSETVLQLTMSYLMHRILDLCDDPQTSLGDWFHFVWDRTRSIRKDITQQELCSLAGVELVEQCARFHIHCAARLVAEDPSVFDKKINAENLTKCLQTLKYMYHDLRIKGVHCPCEAEFRSYVVLLNLGDSNFLWELKQLPESIQKSKHVKRSIAFYNALQNNNFVKFFNMVKSEETSYLSACILLSYFTRLRVRAMDAIIKSHNWRKNDVYLPLSYLTRVLGFEDISATVNFLSYHGLQCEERYERVLLERLTRPDSEYAMDRALNLVESKRLVSVGECVCGNILPSTQLIDCHQPHNSFDANGILKLDAWSAEDQLRGDAAKEKENDVIIIEPEDAAEKPPLPVVIKPNDDANIFKVPQISASISPKHKPAIKPIVTPSPFAAKTVPKESSIANADFKFSGNIFGGNVAAMPPPAITSNEGDSIFKVPAIVAPKASNQTSIFKPNAPSAKPAANIFGGFTAAAQPALDIKSGNIFGSEKTVQTGNIFASENLAQTGNIFATENSVQSGNIFASETSAPTGNIFAIPKTNIFSSVAKETTNIFQQHAAESHAKDNIFQHFQTQPPIFGGFPDMQQNQQQADFSSSSTFPFSHKDDVSLKNFQEMERIKNKLEKEHDLKQKQLAEEKRKLKEMEEQRLKKRQQQEEQQKQKEIERQARERQKLRSLQLQQAAEKEQQNILQQILQEQLDNIAKQQLQLYQNVQKTAEAESGSLIQQLLESMIEEIAQEEYAMMCHDQLLINRYFSRWLQHVKKKQEQRKIMESTPIWVTTDSRAQYAHAVQHPCKDINLEMIKRYRFGQSCNFTELLEMGRCTAREAAEKPLNLFKLIARHLLSHQSYTPSGLMQQKKYFKFLISLPTDEEEIFGYNSFCSKWLAHAVEKAQTETGPFVHGCEQNVALCVRKLAGIQACNEQADPVTHEADHSDGLVCFISGNHLESQTSIRLHNLLKNSKNFKKVPLAIIAYNCCQQKENDDIAQQLNLDGLKSSGLISDYKIFGHQTSKKDFSFRLFFAKSVDYISKTSLAINCSLINSMAMENILSILESCLGEEMWQRWLFSSRENPVFNKICTLPQHVIGIYHTALQQLRKILTKDFLKMPEFPEELREFVPENTFPNVPLGLEFFPSHWKDRKRQNILEKFLQELQLPLPETTESLLFSNVDDLELWLLNYSFSSLSPACDDLATQIAQQAISELVKQLNHASSQDINLQKRLRMLNFISILKPIVFGRINAVLSKFSKVLLDYNVIYIKQDLEYYQMQPWWLDYKPLNTIRIDYNQQEHEEADQESMHDAGKENVNSAQEINAAIEKAEATSRKIEANYSERNLNKVKSSPMHNNLKRSLDESLYQFELSKKIGQFDSSFVDRITDELEQTIQKVTAQTEMLENKRKRLHCTNSSETKLHKSNDNIAPTAANDVHDVIAKAMNLITRIESNIDHKQRIQKSKQLHNLT